MTDMLPGPPAGDAMTGLLRVSCRELDADRSTPHNPVLGMRRELRLKVHHNDVMELTVSAFRFPPFIPLSFGKARVPFPADGLTFPVGHPENIREFGGPPEASASRLATPSPKTRNKGRHIVHYGGHHDSRVAFFELPPAAESGS